MLPLATFPNGAKHWTRRVSKERLRRLWGWPIWLSVGALDWRGRPSQGPLGQLVVKAACAEPMLVRHVSNLPG